MGGSAPLAKLRVSVLEGSGLQGKDFFKKTNTYCCATLEADVKQTSVIKNSQNPHWNQDFYFDVFSPPGQVTLVLEVFDKQPIFRDESLGAVELPLAHLLGSKPHALDSWKVLERRKKKHRPAGQLHFSVELLPEAGIKFDVPRATEDWVVLGDDFRFDDALNGKSSVSLAMSGEGESVAPGMGGESVGRQSDRGPPISDKDFFYPGIEDGRGRERERGGDSEGVGGEKGHSVVERKKEAPERVLHSLSLQQEREKAYEGTGAMRERVGEYSAVEWEESQCLVSPRQSSVPTREIIYISDDSNDGSEVREKETATQRDIGREKERDTFSHSHTHSANAKAEESEEERLFRELHSHSHSHSHPHSHSYGGDSDPQPHAQSVNALAEETEEERLFLSSDSHSHSGDSHSHSHSHSHTQSVNAEAEETEEERLFREFLENELRCLRCGLVQQQYSLVVLEPCGHRHCHGCMADTTCATIRASRITEALCPAPQCSTSVPQFVLKMLLPAEEFEEFINRGLEEVISSCDSLFRCPNLECNVVIERIHQPELSLRSSSATVVGLDGKELSEEARLHREEHRFRCRSCATEFCSGCSRVPYHLGFTCASYEVYLSSQHCRFCEALLPPSASATVPLSPCYYVCGEEECVEKMGRSCTRLLPCLHPCGGIAGERQCLPCLQEGCALDDTGAEDYCNICWVESLGAAPAVQLRCGHVFHQTCVRKKLAERWPSPRITFGFWNCPLCQEKMQHPSLVADLEPLERLREEIVGKALQRLKFENLDKSEDIIKKSGKYYRNPEGYAMDRFAYYPCFQCKKAYFGGQRRCDAGDRAEAFKPEDLVCGGCSGADAGGQCPKHGNEFMEHKCQYCCSVATWYCWGKVHFCDACHTRQQKGDYVSKYPRERLPLCPGKDRCPLQLQHPPNGDPYCLGCVICRNTHDF